MASQLVNEFCCIKHCRGFYERDSVCVDDWTAEWAIIASNAVKCICNIAIEFIGEISMKDRNHCITFVEKQLWRN